MKLITMVGEFNIQSVKFIPNPGTKFLYIQPGKKDESLTLITNIPELVNIAKCIGIFKFLNTINFLYEESCESLIITKITNIDELVRTDFSHDTKGRQLQNLEPLMYLEEYLTGYRLTYSEKLIPHTMLLNYIEIT